MMDILSYVKKQTRFDIGSNKFDMGNIGTPALILCKTKNNQNFHLDIMGGGRKQFGMLFSIRSSSTIVCKTNSESKIEKLEDLTTLLEEGTRIKGEWMTPSVELQEFIEEIKDADLVQDMKDGYGELFRVCTHDDYSENKNFAWTETKIENAPVGSYYSLNGGNIHAGSGSTFSEVRIMLFWTFCSKNLDPYDIDKQETKLTLIVTIGSKIWGSLEKKH